MATVYPFDPTKTTCPDTPKSGKLTEIVNCCFCKQPIMVEIPQDGKSHKFECNSCDCEMEIHGHGGYHIDISRPASSVWRRLWGR